MSAVPCALDEVGWLQFQQLRDLVLELEAGVDPRQWSGEADRTRIVDVERGIHSLDGLVAGDAAPRSTLDPAQAHALARVWPDMVPVPLDLDELPWGQFGPPEDPTPPALPALLDVDRILRDLA